jgi:hypothetical protein
MLASAMQTATVFWFVTTPQMVFIIPVAVIFGFGFAGNMTCLILAVREAASFALAAAVGAVHLLTLVVLIQRKHARQAQGHPGFVGQVSRA